MYPNIKVVNIFFVSETHTKITNSSPTNTAPVLHVPEHKWNNPVPTIGCLGAYIAIMT